MLLDKQTQLADAQAITDDGGVSTNVIDLGVAKSVSGDMELNMNVTTAFTAVGAATLVVTVQTDTVENFASPTALVSTGAIAKATLVAGYKLPVLKLPVDKVERYIRLLYTVATGPFTAGNMDANLVLGSDTEQPR